MKKLPLRDRLYNYLLRTHGWMPSGTLQRIVAQRTSYSPQNVGRRLRELVQEGKLQVRYVKGHAQYRVPEVTTVIDLSSEAGNKLLTNDSINKLVAADEAKTTELMEKFWQGLPAKEYGS